MSSLIILLLLLIIIIIIKNIKKELFTNNPKIALCLSGQLRNKDIFLKSLKEKVIDKFNPDIFLYIDEKNATPEFISSLKPKSYHITNKKPQSKNNLKPNTISMFEKIYKCNKLKSDYEKQFNFKYDIVIRMRPDIMIYSDFDFSNFDKKYLYYPVNIVNKFNECLNLENTLNYGITDQISYGSSDIMNKHSEIYTHLNNKQEFDCKLPEVILKKYIYQNKIPIKKFYLKWSIIDYINFITLNFSKEKKNNFKNMKKFVNKIDTFSYKCFI